MDKHMEHEVKARVRGYMGLNVKVLVGPTKPQRVVAGGTCSTCLPELLNYNKILDLLHRRYRGL